MAEDKNRLDKLNSEEAVKWLDKKWAGDRKCPICSQKNWKIGDPLETRKFTGGGLNIGAPLYVFFPVTCTNCGNTVFINAVSAELAPSAESETELNKDAVEESKKQ